MAVRPIILLDRSCVGSLLRSYRGLMRSEGGSGGSGGMPPRIFFEFSGYLRSILMQYQVSSSLYRPAPLC